MAIAWLPTAGAREENQQVAEENDFAERRNLGRVLKLYFYKVAGWQEETLGLHRVHYVEASEVDWVELGPGEFLRELEGGALLYSPIDATAILPRQRIAVAVHGFSADTKTLGRWLTTVFPKHAPAYDHVLAYDYESLATGISENGRRLADALRALELHVRPRVRVDLFAHSMGTLVSRSMIEQWGGDAFVNRCFLAGPPNQGTRLADAKLVVPWLTSLAI
ncbi:MAG: alpha/beta hydrolase, partial [Caldilineaceae bacterium]|nr:alpha/beta hydrolase [Caldilineaceae bacterium]